MQTDRRRLGARDIPFVLLVTVLCGVAGLQGCGDRHDAKTATQTAAKVNHQEITVHQINFLLNRMRAAAPAAAASASGQVLEQLIDQEVTLQKALDENIDREPAVVDQIEAARREIISRAYIEKISMGVPKPTAKEIQAYYDAHPALFAQRHIYDLQEVDVVATPAQVSDLQRVVADAKSMADVAAQLKAMGVRYTGSQATRAAEQLPLARIDEFAELKDGGFLFRQTPQGAEILHLVTSRPQPVALAQASPAIEQFLLNDRKRSLVADDLRALRKAARIEYVGDFAKGAPDPTAGPSADVAAKFAPSTPPQVVPPQPAITAAPALDLPTQPVAAASMPSSAILEKGLKGMK